MSLHDESSIKKCRGWENAIAPKHSPNYQIFFSSSKGLPHLTNNFSVREHQQKTFVTFSRFWLLRGLSESVKKEKFVTKIFFSVNFEWSSKNLWKMISADVKAKKTIRNKRSGGSVLQIFIRRNFETWNTIHKGHLFFIWFWLVFYPF